MDWVGNEIIWNNAFDSQITKSKSLEELRLVYFDISKNFWSFEIPGTLKQILKEEFSEIKFQIDQNRKFTIRHQATVWNGERAHMYLFFDYTRVFLVEELRQ